MQDFSGKTNGKESMTSVLDLDCFSPGIPLNLSDVWLVARGDRCIALGSQTWYLYVFIIDIFCWKSDAAVSML